MATTVVNAMHEQFDVYIGRQYSYQRVRHNHTQNPNDHLHLNDIQKAELEQTWGYFGNPIEFKKPCEVCGHTHFDTDQGRKDLVYCHKVWLWRKVNSDPEFRERLKQLKGLRLGCFCKRVSHNVPCHGDNFKAWLDAGCPLEDTHK